MPNETKYTASVKVMRSYDYCHFEVNLGSTEPVTLADIDAMRKEAARMADNAVRQYKVSKIAAGVRDNLEEAWRLEHAKKTPEGERSADEKAIIKYHADTAFRARFDYNYEDDFDQPDFDEDDI